MHDNSILVRARIARFVGERVTPAIYRLSAPLTVHAWEVRDEPVPFAEGRWPGVRAFLCRRAVGRAVGHNVVPRHGHRSDAMGATRGRRLRRVCGTRHRSRFLVWTSRLPSRRTGL